MNRQGPHSNPAGFTLVELSIAMTIAAVVLGSMAMSMHREAKGLSEMASRSSAERGASEMLGRLESELEYAIGAAPQGFLMTDLGPGTTAGFTVDTTLGFPSSGILLIDAGTPREERMAYERIVPSTNRFEGLGRGTQCGSKQAHFKNTRVQWAGVAIPIEDQVNPMPEDFDGLAFESTGTVFFRGDGTGFSFRVPTDTAGDGEFFQDGAISWGATVQGEATVDGWSALTFQAVREVIEEDVGEDLDGDGDLDDVFDLGRIRMMSWFALNDDTRRTSVALCPPIVMQKRCDWGGDLDGDGFADPIFLWEPEIGRLHIRMFLVAGQVGDRIQPRRLDTTLYLRNGAWE